jgi:hypothetical protein
MPKAKHEANALLLGLDANGHGESDLLHAHPTFAAFPDQARLLHRHRDS